jgi:hypothetical protein
MRARHRIVAVLIAGALAMGSGAAFAQDRSGPTPPRLALVDGEVSFWRPGAEDWSPAQVNTALAEGDELYAAERANVELQIGSRAFVRAGSDTQIGLEALDDDTMQYRVTGGHAAFDLKRLPSGQSVEIDTPRAAFTIRRPGYYRVDVDEQRSVFSARHGGRAHAIADNGEELAIVDGEQLVLADDTAGFGVTPAAAFDDWDRWNEERTASFAETPRSASYVSSEVAGVDDLDRYGDWQEEPRYGRVWRPRDVGPDWSPYSTGRWVYDPYYEWTWVDDAPWGWAPYHYGRWAHVSGYWGWVPGPIVVRPAYAPALVAFFGGPAVSVSVSVGVPFVSWCPLGFGEPVIPWWGGAHFAGRPYWGGWGGPRIVNNVVINNTRFVDGGRIHRFQNAMVHNAVVGLDRDRFRNGGRPVRVREGRELRLVRGNLDVRPGARSLVPREGRGHRPPDRMRNRPVVATRAGRDPMHRLRARGVEVASTSAAAPKSRVIRPRGGGRNRFAERRGPDATPGTPPVLGSNERGHRFDHRGNARGGQLERGASAGPPPRPGRGHGRANTRNDVAPPPEARGARIRDHATAPEPPRRNRGLGHATPSRPEPPRGSARLERGRREARPEPAPRAQSPNEMRGARRATPRFDRREPTNRRAAPGRSREPNAPREAVPTPMPRGDRTRFERPRSGPQERAVRRSAPERAPRERAQRPDMRTTRREASSAERQAARPTPRMERRVERAAPRVERRAERTAPRQRGGGRRHEREG